MKPTVRQMKDKSFVSSTTYKGYDISTTADSVGASKSKMVRELINRGCKFDIVHMPIEWEYLLEPDNSVFIKLNTNPTISYGSNRIDNF